jgi:hypothetical protein
MERTLHNFKQQMKDKEAVLYHRDKENAALTKKVEELEKNKRTDWLNALEFGYIKHEEGKNIQQAIAEFDVIYFKKKRFTRW